MHILVFRCKCKMQPNVKILLIDPKFSYHIFFVIRHQISPFKHLKSDFMYANIDLTSKSNKKNILKFTHIFYGKILNKSLIKKITYFDISIFKKKSLMLTQIYFK